MMNKKFSLLLALVVGLNVVVVAAPPAGKGAMPAHKKESAAVQALQTKVRETQKHLNDLRKKDHAAEVEARDAARKDLMAAKKSKDAEKIKKAEVALKDKEKALNAKNKEFDATPEGKKARSNWSQAVKALRDGRKAEAGK